MGLAKVTRNYQVTIPKDIRTMQEIRIGDTVVFSIENNRVELLKKDPKKALEDVMGIWKGKESGIAYVRRIRAESEKRMARLGLKAN